MDITACICTRDRPQYLRDCLNGLSQQTVGTERFDILVVDSASCGQTPALIARLVAGIANARLLRMERPGVSFARNAGASAARGSYIAYIDDDAIPAPDWIERILATIAETDPPPALIGGRIMPHWEAPLPMWWPPHLRGTLSIIECEGQGEYRTAALPAGLEPYGANMVVHVPTLLAIGGFGRPKRTCRQGAAVGRGRAACVAPAGGRPLGALRLADRGAAPDPGGTPDPALAAVAALLARRFHRADPSAARSIRRGLARVAAPLRGGCACWRRSVCCRGAAPAWCPAAGGSPTRAGFVRSALGRSLVPGE